MIGNGVISIEKYLKDKFDYSFNGNLDEFYNKDFIEFEVNGVKALFWIKEGNDRYLFKETKEFEYNMWGELLSKEFADELGIKCAKYCLASFNNKKGFLTKSFIKENDELIHGNELIQRAIDNNISQIITEKAENIARENKGNVSIPCSKKLNNFKDMCEIINKNKKISEEEKKNIKYNLAILLCFDMITMQQDRHPNNYGLIKKDGKYTFSPIFDNNCSFGLEHFDMNKRCTDYFRDIQDYKRLKNENLIKAYKGFNLSYNYSGNNSNVDCLKEMLESEEIDFISILSSMCEICDVDYLEKTIKKLEDKYSITMRNDVYFYITDLYENNLNYIKSEINKYMKGDNYGENQNDRRI